MEFNQHKIIKGRDSIAPLHITLAESFFTLKGNSFNHDWKLENSEMSFAPHITYTVPNPTTITFTKGSRDIVLGTSKINQSDISSVKGGCK